MSLKDYIEDRFDVEGLREWGFLTDEKTPEEISKRICTWFGLKNIYMYDHIGEHRSKTVKADIKTFSEN